MTASLLKWSDAQKSTEPSQLNLAEKYDAIAHRWHRTIQRLGYVRAYKALFAQLRQENHLPDGGRLLDCGIGSGALSQAVLETAPRAWAVEGIDLAPNMLHEAANCLRPHVSTLRLHCTDVCHLPQAEASFDLVISAHMLEHLLDPVAGLGEMVRVLKPGASLVLLVTRCGLIGSLLRHKWQIHCLATDEVLVMMKAAGLNNVQVVAQTRWWLPCRWSSVVYMGQR